MTPPQIQPGEQIVSFNDYHLLFSKKSYGGIQTWIVRVFVGAEFKCRVSEPGNEQKVPLQLLRRVEPEALTAGISQSGFRNLRQKATKLIFE